VEYEKKLESTSFSQTNNCLPSQVTTILCS
jgi:hypothetical protein